MSMTAIEGSVMELLENIVELRKFHRSETRHGKLVPCSLNMIYQIQAKSGPVNSHLAKDSEEDRCINGR